MLRSHLQLRPGCACTGPSLLPVAPLPSRRVFATAAGSPVSVSPTAMHLSGGQVHSVTTLQPQQAASPVQQLTELPRQSIPSSRPGPPEEDYTSTSNQQAIVWGAALLFLAVELRGLSQISSPWGAAQCALAAFAGYLLAGDSLNLRHACLGCSTSQLHAALDCDCPEVLCGPINCLILGFLSFLHLFQYLLRAHPISF